MSQTSLNSTGVASSGALSLQSNGTTEAIGISTGQVATLAQNPILTSGTVNGLAFLNASKVLTTGSALVFDGTNLGLGVTPSAWSGFKVLQIGAGGALANPNSLTRVDLTTNAYYNGSQDTYIGTGTATSYRQNNGNHIWYYAASGTAGNYIGYSESMRIDASGNLLVGTPSTGAYQDGRLNVVGAGSQPAITGTISSTAAAQFVYSAWSQPTSGNNQFMSFETETTPVIRGSITYNRGAGLVAYNVMSDYRAKDISGPVTGSGALIDSTPVYMGKMKGATQERPMFIAHEVPAYAHTGEKDAVDADGNPVYQQMDTSALVPVMWAEIQSLRQRLAAAGI